MKTDREIMELLLSGKKVQSTRWNNGFSISLGSDGMLAGNHGGCTFIRELRFLIEAPEPKPVGVDWIDAPREFSRNPNFKWEFKEHGSNLWKQWTGSWASKDCLFRYTEQEQE